MMDVVVSDAHVAQDNTILAQFVSMQLGIYECMHAMNRTSPMKMDGGTIVILIWNLSQLINVEVRGDWHQV